MTYILRRVKFNLYGQLINSGLFLSVKLKKENPDNLVSFVKINEIFLINDNIYLYCQVFKSSFVTHFHSFEIFETEKFVFLETDEIYHYHPLNEIKNLIINDKRLFLRPHCLIKNYF